MPHHRPPSIRRDASGVGQINLMMHPVIGKIIYITVFFKKCIHQINGRRLVIESSDMHALDAQPFFYGKKFHFGIVLFFLSLCLRNCPVNILFLHEIRQGRMTEIHCSLSFRS